MSEREPGRGPSRDLVLERVRGALEGRSPAAHPGPLIHGSTSDPVDVFAERVAKSGGVVVALSDALDPGPWLTRAIGDLMGPSPGGPGGPDGPPTVAGGAEGPPTVVVGPDVPPRLIPDLPRAPAHEARVGVSVARAGAADTGSVLLSSEGSRRVQLLPPVHVVWLPRSRVHPRLEDALADVRGALPRALGIHSGPSKSADIGRVLVEGVHGPGRLVVVLLEDG